MFKVERIKNYLTALIISIMYILLLSKILNISLLSLLSNEYNINVGIYYQIHFTYFMCSSVIFVDRLIKQFRVRQIKFSNRYRSVLLFYVFAGLIIITNIIFVRNILGNSYFNILPSFSLLILMIFNGYLQSDVYVTEDSFSTNGETYLLNEIIAIQYNESFRITLETSKKKYKIFCISEERYEFIKGIVDEYIT